MKKYNYFISFEGPEGSGKSTIIKLIEKKLKMLDIDFLITREPGGKNQDFSEQIRELILKNKIDKLTELYLFHASRKEHINKLILPNINDGKLVITDRFVDSSTVYQGITRNIDINIINTLNNATLDGCWPSLTILFDIDPKIGLKRIDENMRERNRFDNEELEFHNKIRNAYLDLAKNNDRFIVIDANRTIDEVFSDVYEIILNHIGVNDD